MINLTDSKGPRTKFKVLGSPGTPGLGDKWAFGYERSVYDPNYVSRERQEARAIPDLGVKPDGNEDKTADKIWSSIPSDTDILITHTPPYGHCDLGVVRRSDGLSETGEVGEKKTEKDRHLGCYSLLQRLSVVRPRLHVCGHVHRARGAERVQWPPPSPHTLDRGEDISSDAEGGWTESGTGKWTDPSPDPKSAKISLVDLTGRGRGEGSRRLDWDDAEVSDAAGERGKGRERRREGRKETCVVNCAILASNYPHAGGKKFHKPVVVDLELPVCEEGDRGVEKV